jgi:hypothetical protein
MTYLCEIEVETPSPRQGQRRESAKVVIVESLSIETRPPAQWRNLSVSQALVIARERFGNLCATGILGRRFLAKPIDEREVAIALAFLQKCRKTKTPRLHTLDLVHAIGQGVSVGAVIAAAVGLGFDVRAWYGVTTFVPHAMIGVNASDMRRVSRR